MNVLQKIACAAIESMGSGGGGIPKFFDRQIEVMPDYERRVLANKLCVVMPELTAKFQKMGRYENWLLSLLSEDRWYTEIRRKELWASCKKGVNDTNVTLHRLERNLEGALDNCCPGWELKTRWEAWGTELDEGENVDWYLLGELDAARDAFKAMYPNATWPEVDEELLAQRRAKEAAVDKAAAESRAEYKRTEQTWAEVKSWDRETVAELVTQEALFEGRGFGANKSALNRAQAAHKVDHDRQQDRMAVQKQRLKDGLPMYAPGEGPDRLE